MTRRIPLASPELGQLELEAVTRVVRSGRLALGPELEAFESDLAGRVGSDHVVAVSSGTAALHLSLLALGIGTGDEVIVPSYTFVATVNAVLYVGATPVFADIGPESPTLSPDDVDRCVTDRTRAIVAVDAFGEPADWQTLRAIAARHGVATIDDAAEALGSRDVAGPIGALADVTTFAFYPNKQITTGEGGAISTDDAELARRVRSLRNQGRADGGRGREFETLGFNYRMDELSAALGRAQLARIDSLERGRDRIARLYDRALEDVPGVRVPRHRPGTRVSRFAYVVRLDESIDRDRVISLLDEAGIESRDYFPPVHLMPYIRASVSNRTSRPLPQTELAGRTSLALPFFSNMDVADPVRVVERLREAIARSGTGTRR